MARGAGGGLVRIGGRNPNPSSGAGRGGVERSGREVEGFGSLGVGVWVQNGTRMIGGLVSAAVGGF
jgi:hypothetical protein